jgi:hypothetical protein
MFALLVRGDDAQDLVLILEKKVRGSMNGGFNH